MKVVDQYYDTCDRCREDQRNGEGNLLQAHGTRQEGETIPDETRQEMYKKRYEGLVRHVHEMETLSQVLKLKLLINNYHVYKTANDDDGNFQDSGDEGNFPTAAEFRMNEDDGSRVDLVRFDVNFELLLRRTVIIETEEFNLAWIEL